MMAYLNSSFFFGSFFLFLAQVCKVTTSEYNSVTVAFLVPICLAILWGSLCGYYFVQMMRSLFFEEVEQ